MIKVATENDIPVIIELMKSQKRFMGDPMTPERIQKYCDHFVLISKNTSIDQQIVFYIDETGQIISSARQILLTNINKAWIYSGLLVRPNLNTFDTSKNGVDEITKYFIERAESKGFYTYSFLMVAGKDWKNRTIDMRNRVEVLHRYEYFDEAYIPANFKPVEQKFWFAMGNEVWSSNLVYRTGMLRNEYRDPALLILK